MIQDMVLTGIWGKIQIFNFPGGVAPKSRLPWKLINEHATITYEQVSLDEDQFREETMKAFTRQELGILNFVYSAVKKGSSMELTWKKHILSDNIKFLLGSVTMSLCRDQGATKLLDFAVSALEENQQEIRDLQKENSRLSSERQGALARLEKCANLQEDIEKDLFGKFKVVLNEKKAKIRRLMEQLNSVSEQLHNLQQTSKTVVSQPSATNKEDTKEDPGNQSENGTDDEMAHSPSPIGTEQQPPRGSPAPATTGQPMESLLGDPSERTISSPPVKRRKRNEGVRPTSKVKGQPVELPRPPLISRLSSQSAGRSKVRVRTTSSDSKKSEDSMESDDLLQLL